MEQPGVAQMMGEMVIPGMLVATVALVLLIFFVYGMGWVLNKKKGATAPSAGEASAPQAHARPAQSAALPEETVAVISAAIASVMDEPYDITSITPSQEVLFAPIVAAIAASTVAASPSAPAAPTERGRRPVWSFAGMQQNTKPFGGR